MEIIYKYILLNIDTTVWFMFYCESAQHVLMQSLITSIQAIQLLTRLRPDK